MRLIPFGDSHTYFWGKQTQFPGESFEELVPEMFWLGPAKAYGLSMPTKNQTIERFLTIKAQLEQPEVIPIGCFGEIDIRVNCAKEFIFNGGTGHISDLVDAYLKKLSTINSSTVVVWGPPPSAPDHGLFSTEFPAYGDNKTRNYLTHCFNAAVIEKIASYPKLKFFTMFYNLVNPDLTTKTMALADGCHLSTVFQPLAIDLMKRLLNSDDKILINVEEFNSVRIHKRVFYPVTNWDKTPYINFYKKEAGNILHFFSYAPLTESGEELICAGLKKL